MKKLILLTLLGIAPLAYASPMSQSDIDQLIQKLQALHNNQPSLQANFREERHLTMLKDPVVNEGKVWFTLPDKIRREIGGKTPSTTVIDGKKMSIYYPNYQQLEIYDLRGDTPKSHRVSFPEPAYAVFPNANAEVDANADRPGALDDQCRLSRIPYGARDARDLRRQGVPRILRASRPRPG